MHGNEKGQLSFAAPFLLFQNKLLYDLCHTAMVIIPLCNIVSTGFYLFFTVTHGRTYSRSLKHTQIVGRIRPPLSVKDQRPDTGTASG